MNDFPSFAVFCRFLVNMGTMSDVHEYGIIHGVKPETSSGFIGSYRFRDQLSDDQHDRAPDLVYIVIEIEVDKRSVAKRIGNVSCKHDTKLVIVNAGWICFAKHRAVMPKYFLTNDCKMLHFNNFETSNETNVMYSDNKYPGRDKRQWVEFVVSDLEKRKWGPCKSTA
jgi:hypothetical protein